MIILVVVLVSAQFGIPKSFEKLAKENRKDLILKEYNKDLIRDSKYMRYLKKTNPAMIPCLCERLAPKIHQGDQIDDFYENEPDIFLLHIFPRLHSTVVRKFIQEFFKVDDRILEVYLRHSFQNQFATGEFLMSCLLSRNQSEHLNLVSLLGKKSEKAEAGAVRCAFKFGVEKRYPEMIDSYIYHPAIDAEFYKESIKICLISGYTGVFERLVEYGEFDDFKGQVKDGALLSENIIENEIVSKRLKVCVPGVDRQAYIKRMFKDYISSHLNMLTKLGVSFDFAPIADLIAAYLDEKDVWISLSIAE